jgi:dienelactone hydrolase
MTLLVAVLALLLGAGAVTAQELRMVPVTVDGEAVKLAMRIYTPATPGPVPTLVFNHGSTGGGTNPDIMVRSIDFPALAKFFTDRGWAVVMPARRGRGGSEGVYDEGFGADRSRGYTDEPSISIAGAERALRDIDAAMTAIVAMPFVDRERLIIGGQSRGGILAVVWAATRPGRAKAVINFVGGWHGMMRTNGTLVNRTLFGRGGAYPQEILWLYGDEDPFYDLSYSRENFAAFQAAGGKGAFVEFRRPATNSGHRIVEFPEMWSGAVDAYLTRQGF